MDAQASVALQTATRDVRITVFPPLPASNCGGGCSCNPGPNVPDPIQAFLQQLNEAKSDVDDAFQVEVIQYTTIPQFQHAIDSFNHVLRQSGHADALSNLNPIDLLMMAAPVIAVNDVIVTLGGLPMIDQLVTYIRTL